VLRAVVVELRATATRPIGIIHTLPLQWSTPASTPASTSTWSRPMSPSVAKSSGPRTADAPAPPVLGVAELSSKWRPELLWRSKQPWGLSVIDSGDSR
jgi:hypothetical protein